MVDDLFAWEKSQIRELDRCRLNDESRTEQWKFVGQVGWRACCA